MLTKTINIQKVRTVIRFIITYTIIILSIYVISLGTVHDGKKATYYCFDPLGCFGYEYEKGEFFGIETSNRLQFLTVYYVLKDFNKGELTSDDLIDVERYHHNIKQDLEGKRK